MVAMNAVALATDTVRTKQRERDKRFFYFRLDPQEQGEEQQGRHKQDEHDRRQPLITFSPSLKSVQK